MPSVPVLDSSLRGFARQLVLDDVLAETDALEIQLEAERRGESFIKRSVATRSASALAIAEAAARKFSMRLVDLDTIDLQDAPTQVVPARVLRKHDVLPLWFDNDRLTVGIADPVNHTAIDEMSFLSGLTIDAVVVEQDKLDAMLDRLTKQNMTNIGNAELDRLWVEEGGDDDDDDIDESEADSAPVIRVVNQAILQAVQEDASDIHFEPYEARFRVRLRRDGVLNEIMSLPASMGRRIAARLKVMARLDLAERRLPQDGRVKLSMASRSSVDFRVSACPTLYGEKIVMRLLDPNSARMGIEALGYEPEQQRVFETTLHKPHGMILVTGPTGSGKTVSLYTALNILNGEGINISTAEDPAEINLPDINQVNVRPRIGLTFASCLRSFLRQDPDVIMVGEIRDIETAEIAIKAAQTGHLVLSTLHTNDAPRTLSRLLNMGVPGYNIADSVSLIIAQRLARRLCAHCKRKADIPREEMIESGFSENESDNLVIYEANDPGCGQCNRGYRGRIGLYEVMPVSRAVGQIIMGGGNAFDIETQARREGVDDLHTSGLKKVRSGVLSLAEVNRVTVD